MALKDYISRQTLRLTRTIEVHQLDAFIVDLPETHTVRQSVDVHTLKPEMKIDVRTVDLKEKLICRTEGFMLADRTIKAKGFRPKKYIKQDISVHGMPKRRKLNIWKGAKRAQSLPVELPNKLKQLRNKPAILKNEVILAWYWPIVDGAVIKLALNKQRGTLLVWYDPRSRKYKARGVYLIRRLGLGEKPEWRWV